MDDNTLQGFHIKSKKGEPLKIYPKKYTWHIPKKLRDLNIQPGDIVGVPGLKGNFVPVLVTEVFREELENTGKNIQESFHCVKKHPKKSNEKRGRENDS